MEGTANNIDLRPRVKACDLISEYTKLTNWLGELRIIMKGRDLAFSFFSFHVKKLINKINHNLPVILINL